MKLRMTVILILTVLIISMIACKSTVEEPRKPEFSLNINIDDYTESINFIINKLKAKEDNLNIPDNISTELVQHLNEIDTNIVGDIEIVNTYYFNGCIMVQFSSISKNYMLKIEVKEGKLTNYLVYELLN